MSDSLFAKARAFTDVETQTLLEWNAALAAGLNVAAAAVLDAGLYAEHLRSLLDADMGQWTIEQHAEYGRAVAALADAITTSRRMIDAISAITAAGSPLQGAGGGTGVEGGYGHP